MVALFLCNMVYSMTMTTAIFKISLPIFFANCLPAPFLQWKFALKTAKSTQQKLAKS